MNTGSNDIYGGDCSGLGGCGGMTMLLTYCSMVYVSKSYSTLKSSYNSSFDEVFVIGTY
jgi:hypothetical protein